MASGFTIQISVVAATKPGETVAVVGEPKELGGWNYRGAILLTTKSASGGKALWTGQLKLHDLPGSDASKILELRYRYFLCRRLLSSSSGKPHTVITDWECSLQPRSRQVCALPLGKGCYADTRLIEDTYGELDGQPLQTTGGWLCDPAVHQVQLHLADDPVLFDPAAIYCADSIGSRAIASWLVRCVPLVHSALTRATGAANQSDPAAAANQDLSLCDSLANAASAEELDGSITVPTACPVWTTVSVVGEFADREHLSNAAGEQLNTGSYMIFKMHTADCDSTAYRLEFYLLPARKSLPADDNASVVPSCHAYVLPEQLLAKDSGTIACTLQSGSRLVGSVCVKYLVAKPCAVGQLQHSMEFGLDSPLLWRRGWCAAAVAATDNVVQPPDVLLPAATAAAAAVDAAATAASLPLSHNHCLLIGHRGLGSTPAKGVLSTGMRDRIYENTLTSFARAHHYGADMVEFDINLSKDKVPVIYHDFLVPILLQNSSIGSAVVPDVMAAGGMPAHMAINELAADVLPTVCRIAHQPSDGAGWVDGPRVFPILEQALRTLSSDVGFVIEIKYPQLMKSGALEEPLCANIVNRNEYIDRILDVVMRHTGSRTISTGNNSPSQSQQRRLAFACFDADVCALLRLKQAICPVFFLTMGRTKQWELYSDVRTHLVETAVFYAANERFHGVSVNSEDCGDFSVIRKAHDAGLAFWAWGNECNDPQTFQSLRDQGADGIIYDRLGDFR